MINDATVQAVMKFVQERNWDQFHSEENLAKSISIESAELLECYQWSDSPRDGDRQHVADELADILTYCIQMAEKLHLDMDEIILDKLDRTKEKYPITTSWGSSRKYRSLE